MRPPFSYPCSKNWKWVKKTIVDRYNKLLLCPKGVSYRKDMLIKPYPKCAEFWSYRCAKCFCRGVGILCSGSFFRRIKRWNIVGQCCIPEFECTRSSLPGAPKPQNCGLSPCHWADPEGIWELNSSIPPIWCR